MQDDGKENGKKSNGSKKQQQQKNNFIARATPFLYISLPLFCMNTTPCENVLYVSLCRFFTAAHFYPVSR